MIGKPTVQGTGSATAVLSTYTLLVRRRERRRQVKVNLSWGMLALGNEPTPVFFLEARTVRKPRRPMLRAGGLSREPATGYAAARR